MKSTCGGGRGNNLPLDSGSVKFGLKTLNEAELVLQRAHNLKIITLVRLHFSISFVSISLTVFDFLLV